MGINIHFSVLRGANKLVAAAVRKSRNQKAKPRANHRGHRGRQDQNLTAEVAEQEQEVRKVSALICDYLRKSAAKILL